MDNTLVIILGAGVLFLIITWVAIIDIATKDFGSQPVKIGWGIFVALVPFIGCIAYFIFGYKKGKRGTKKEEMENNV